MNANTYQSPAKAGGNREDLRDVLTILEPEETPYTSQVTKTSQASSTLVEVLADTLRPPRTGGSPEGKDGGKGNNKVTKRRRFGTYIHRLEDEYSVSDVQQAISKRGGVAAVSDEFANDKAKTIREAKRDIEAICCSDGEHNGQNDADMTTRGCFTWITVAGHTGQTVAPYVADDFLHPAGSAAVKSLSGAASTSSFTEAILNDAFKALSRIHGGKRTYACIFGDDLMGVVDQFTRTNSSSTATRYQVQEQADKHEITMMVKVFDSTFGRGEFIPTQFNKCSTAGVPDASAGLILHMPLWYLDFLEQLHSEDNPPTKGGQDGWIKAMFANCCKMPKGNGKITQ